MSPAAAGVIGWVTGTLGTAIALAWFMVRPRRAKQVEWR